MNDEIRDIIKRRLHFFVARKLGPYLVALAGCLWLIIGYWALDFGQHWDESTIGESVQHTFETHVFLPIVDGHDPFLNYPSVLYWVGIFAGYLTSPFDWPQFRLVTRFICLLLTFSGAIGLACTSKAKRWGRTGSLFAAGVYLASWQLAYHGRWIAPDGLLAAMTCFFLASFLAAWEDKPATRATFFPAIAAGLATGIKYTGGILLLPVMLASFLSPHARKRSLRNKTTRALYDLAVFVVVFLITTPGILFFPHEFQRDLAHERHHYATSHGTFLGVWPYNMKSGASYAFFLFKYIATELSSDIIAISIALFTLALLGIILLVRHDWRLAICLGSWPIVLFLFFCSQTVFIVRNFLIFLPCIALFSGFAVARIHQGLVARHSSIFSRLFVGLAACALGFSSLVAAKNSFPVRHWSKRELFERMVDRIEANEAPLRLSQGARILLAEHGYHMKVHRASDCADTTTIVLQSELIRVAMRGADSIVSTWPANGGFHFDTISAGDVDIDYYPTWPGENRAFVFNGFDFGELFQQSSQHALGLRCCQPPKDGRTKRRARSLK